jgi:hypothetical protein
LLRDGIIACEHLKKTDQYRFQEQPESQNEFPGFTILLCQNMDFTRLEKAEIISVEIINLIALNTPFEIITGPLRC